jgi:hypothetical protein
VVLHDVAHAEEDLEPGIEGEEGLEEIGLGPEDPEGGIGEVDLGVLEGEADVVEVDQNPG